MLDLGIVIVNYNVRDLLRDCLGRLSGGQRESIRLHYEHGLHCKEIGQRLDIGFEAVKKHLAALSGD